MVLYDCSSLRSFGGDGVRFLASSVGCVGIRSFASSAGGVGVRSFASSAGGVVVRSFASSAGGVGVRSFASSAGGVAVCSVLLGDCRSPDPKVTSSVGSDVDEPYNPSSSGSFGVS